MMWSPRWLPPVPPLPPEPLDRLREQIDRLWDALDAGNLAEAVRWMEEHNRLSAEAAQLERVRADNLARMLGAESAAQLRARALVDVQEDVTRAENKAAEAAERLAQTMPEVAEKLVELRRAEEQAVKDLARVMDAAAGGVGGRVARDIAGEIEDATDRLILARERLAQTTPQIAEHLEAIAFATEQAQDELAEVVERALDVVRPPKELPPEETTQARAARSIFEDISDAQEKAALANARLAELTPQMARWMVEAEYAAQAATDAFDDMMAHARDQLREQVHGIPEPVPLTDLDAKWKAFNDEMDRLNDAMHPVVVEQLAEMEERLSQKRRQAAAALEAARAKYAEPEDVLPAGPKPRGPGVLDFLGAVRGTLGGLFGRLVGGGLDVAAAVGKMGGGGGKGAGGAGGGAAGAAGGALTGLAGSAAMAVGAVGAAVAVLDTFRQAATGAISALGGFAAQLISPQADPSQYADLVGRGLQAMGDKLFYVNPALGTLASVAGAAYEALGAVMKSLDGMAERFRRFSPDVALAEAQANVAQTLGDLRRAQEAGPQLAEYVRARTEIQQRWEDTKVRIMMRLVGLAETMMSSLNTVSPFIEATALGAEGANMWLKGLKLGLDNIFKKMPEPEKNYGDEAVLQMEQVMRELQAGLGFPEGGR
jgi:hypothetical protein